MSHLSEVSADVHEAVARITEAKALMRLASNGKPWPAYRLKRSIDGNLIQDRQRRLRMRHRNLVLARRLRERVLLAGFDALEARSREIARIIAETGNDDLREYFDLGGKRTVSIYDPRMTHESEFDSDAEVSATVQALQSEYGVTNLMLPMDGAVYHNAHTLKRSPKSRRGHRRGPIIQTRHNDERELVREHGTLFPNLTSILTVGFWRDSAIGRTEAQTRIAFATAASRDKADKRSRAVRDSAAARRQTALERLVRATEARKARAAADKAYLDNLALRQSVVLETPDEAHERNR